MVFRFGEGWSRLEPTEFSVLQRKIATGRHELVTAYLAPQEPIGKPRIEYSRNIGRLVAGYVAGRPLRIVDGPGGKTDEELRLSAPRATDILTTVFTEQQVQRRDDLRRKYRGEIRRQRPLRRMWRPLSEEEQANDPASALIQAAAEQAREDLNDFQGETSPEELLGHHILEAMTDYPDVIGTANLIEVTTDLLRPQIDLEQRIARVSFGLLSGPNQ